MAENTHVINTGCKLYLRADLSGGDRGVLGAGVEVAVDAFNWTWHTAHVVSPKVGWVDDDYLEALPGTPPAGTEEYILHVRDGVTRKFIPVIGAQDE